MYGTKFYEYKLFFPDPTLFCTQMPGSPPPPPDHYLEDEWRNYSRYHGHPHPDGLDVDTKYRNVELDVAREAALMPGRGLCASTF